MVLRNRKTYQVVFMLSLCLVTLSACYFPSYKFNGASIDYEKTKTIQIDNFPIRSAYVWTPMQSIFQNKLTDIFASQTKLRQVKKNGDLQLAGEITGCALIGCSVFPSSLFSLSRAVTVKVYSLPGKRFLKV